MGIVESSIVYAYLYPDQWNLVNQNKISPCPIPSPYVTCDYPFILGFEERVVGMRPGESKSVTLNPEQVFGDRREDLVLKLPKTEFPQHITPSVGLQLKMSNASGADLTVVITEVGDDSVTLDGNHPLAGQTIVFDIELIKIKK